MPHYELTLVLSGKFEREKTDQVLKTVEDQVKKATGQVEKTDSWGKKILAYPINKVSEGLYYLLTLSFTDAQNIKKLEEHLKINEDLLRYLVIRKITKGKAVQPKKVKKTFKKPVKKS